MAQTVVTIDVLTPGLDTVTVNNVEQLNASNKQSAEVGVAAAGVGNATGTLVSIASANADGTKITVNDAMANKNNSMFILANITTVGNSGTITVKAGDEYPNKCLGDYTYTCKAGYNAILLEDISRFENRDDSIVLIVGGTIVGDIFVVGKRVGIDSVANQNKRDDMSNRTLHKTDYAG